jgi:hypothetical protein
MTSIVMLREAESGMTRELHALRETVDRQVGIARSHV